jgi:hypothetical protein
MNPEERLLEIEAYTGPITELLGKDVMPQTQLDTLLSELILTKAPLLTKVAHDIKTLTTAQTNPADFSPEISEDTTPLAVLTDNRTLTSITQAFPKYGDKAEFQFQAQQGTSTTSQLESLSEVIIIANRPDLEALPFTQAMFLAKEGLTLGVINRIGTELGAEYSVLFTDLNGQPVTNPQKLEQYGMTILARYETDKKTDIEKLTDILPFMMLSLDLEELANKGTIAAQIAGLGPFYQALDYMQQHPQLKARIKDLHKAWVGSDQTTGPDGFSNSILIDPDHIVITGIRELNSIVYQKK